MEFCSRVEVKLGQPNWIAVVWKTPLLPTLKGRPHQGNVLESSSFFFPALLGEFTAGGPSWAFIWLEDENIAIINDNICKWTWSYLQQHFICLSSCYVHISFYQDHLDFSPRRTTFLQACPGLFYAAFWLHRKQEKKAELSTTLAMAFSGLWGQLVFLSGGVCA